MGYSIDTAIDSCYEGTTCLINKLDIRDASLLAQIEAEITFAKASQLELSPIADTFDFEHYKAFTDTYLRIFLSGQVECVRRIFPKKELCLHLLRILR